jgi:hypothetical protein
VADQVACPHRARPQAAHQDQHTIMVRSLCGTVRLAGWPRGSPTHPIHKPRPRSLPRFYSVSITRQSGKKRIVLACYVHHDRLIDALGRQAFAALTASPGARAYYDELRGRGTGHHAALRQLANRLVGILHGCLTTGTNYGEHTAWGHHHKQDQQNAA